MLLYFGSRSIMHQGNARLCDLHHRYPEFFKKLELPKSAEGLIDPQRLRFLGAL
jgi:hypothetical protein